MLDKIWVAPIIERPSPAVDIRIASPHMKPSKQIQDKKEDRKNQRTSKEGEQEGNAVCEGSTPQLR